MFFRKVVFLEEMAVDPLGTIASVFDFVGVDLVDEKEGIKVSSLYDPRGLSKPRGVFAPLEMGTAVFYFGMFTGRF